MSESLLFVAVIGLSGAACATAMAALYIISRTAPADDREYKDPLPAWLRVIWPAVRFTAWAVSVTLPPSYLAMQFTKLRSVGMERMLEPAQFVSLRIFFALLSGGIAWRLMSLMGEEDMAHKAGYLAASMTLGYLVPVIWLGDMRARQQSDVLKTLPTFMDYLTMAVEAGLNMSGAIEQAVDKGPQSVMRTEFKRVLRDLRSGVTRAEALRRMADRIDMPVIRSFVSSITQAERMGANMGPTLRIMADQRRSERFQRAEKMAMEAPVKLLFPLMAFIFPVTFIILAFPIVMKFMQEGLL